MNISVLLLFYGLIYSPILVIGFVLLIFVIKLMLRGIIALDNYIEENNNHL